MPDFPTLETPRLWLRQTTEADAEAIFSLFLDPQVTQFHDLDTFMHLDQARAVIERRKIGFKGDRGIRWAIALKLHNNLIGSCGFTWDRTASQAEVGYELAREFWRQGILLEALSAIFSYGFEVENLQSIVAEVMVDNLASKQLLKKQAFKARGY
jgi:ribosomal-protein-alanine N-acetyltransferase